MNGPVHSEGALSSDSARALDALVEAGFSASKVAPQAPAELQARVERAARLLAMLDGPAQQADRALTDVIMARIALAEELPAEMSAPDHAALESLVMHGFEPGRVPASLRERAERHRALADLVCAARVAPADGLVDRTLAAVQREIDAEEDRFDFESRRAVFSGMRLADILSVAAMLLIATAVVWPLVTSLRESQQKALCFGRVGTMAAAFSNYAMGAADALPVAAGSVSDGVWWDVGTQGRSNSANLFKLAPEGYLTVEDMACPGNAEARTADATPGERDWHEFGEVSFSYQHVDIASSRVWEAPGRFVVLADRSPITVLNKRGEVAPAEANSLNHGQLGQRVLMSDGSAEWLRSPVLPDGDNIWLPRVVEVILDNMRGSLLKGQERPVSSTDSMLVP